LERTRIVLIDMPPLLRDVIRGALVPEPDLDVVGEHDGPVDIRAAVEEDGADFVILGSGVASEESVRALIEPARGVRALEVLSDGTQSVLYELRPHRVALGEISTDTLLRTVRTAPGWDDEPVPDQASERRTA
jgi:DNA-binding NarL/FixJ family response regulator